MSRHSIEEVMRFVLSAAHEQRESAGYNGQWDDGGASRLEDQVKFYKLGMAGTVPPEWEKLIPPPSPEQVRAENHPIQFEYCECGCHCHAAYSKGIGYTIYNSLEKKNAFSLRRGHGILGTQIGPKRNSFEECVKAAQEDFDKIP